MSNLDGFDDLMTGSQFPDRRPPLRLNHVVHLRAGHDANERPKPATSRASDGPRSL